MSQKAKNGGVVSVDVSIPKLDFGKILILFILVINMIKFEFRHLL